MKLSSTSAEVFGEFFVEQGWISDVSEFPEVKIYAGTFAKYFTGLMMAEGVTFGRSIFIDPKFMLRDKKGRANISRSLLAHEIVHVMQYSQSGFLGFLKNYVAHFLSGYFKRGKLNAKNWYAAYLDIPHEREARECAAKFVKWSGGKFS